MNTDFEPDDERLQQLKRNIENGHREFGPLDVIALHTALGEALEHRRVGKRDPHGLCPKGCGALIYLGHPHMCSADR